MRELLILLAVAPFGLLVVLSKGLDDLKTAAVPLPAAAIVVPVVVPATAGAGSMLEAAYSWLGTPYLWGGCTKRGVDCSCFVRNVLAAVGINAPRTTTEQIRWAIPVPRDQIAPGDLVFFNNTCTGCGPNPTHVGLALGGGMMIDAGDPVQIEPIYWAKFAGAGRAHR